MHMLVLIERDPPSYGSWPSLILKKKFPNLSVQEVVTKYQGFEGELVCFFEVKENTSDFQKNLDECLRMKALGNCLLLHVISSPSEMPFSIKDRAIKLGYDVGICDEEATIYSSIFHEVLFGYFDELIAYKDLLNESFLFPDRSLAEKYVKVHDELSVQGRGVEDYFPMTIYEIWRHRDK